MTPREKFQRDKQAVKSHAAIVDDAFVEATFEVALAEMLWRQSPEDPIQDGIRQTERLHGAKKFIEIWRGLSDGTKKVEKDAKDDDSGRLELEDDDSLIRKPKK